MHLNHPETTPSTPSSWKNYLPQKSVFGAKKVSVGTSVHMENEKTSPYRLYMVKHQIQGMSA